MKRFLYKLLVIFVLSFTALFAKEDHRNVRVLFFYSETCQACLQAKNNVISKIEKEFKNKIKVEYLPISIEDNFRLMLGLKEKYNCKKDGVPTVFIEGEILVGYDRIKQDLVPTILKILEEKRTVHLEPFSVDLIERFKTFRIFTILSAGLVDGINPCAFTVIVFFISFLSVQGYKKRELLAVGLSFIFAVFIIYVLLGLGLFKFLYALKGFYLVSRTLDYLIAFLCFFLGFCALYDLVVFLKTGKTETMILQLPKPIKDKIHYIIGLYYRKTSQEKKEVTLKKLILTAFLVGCLVSLLEAVCTGQLYLPTLGFVLKEPSLRLKALGFIILYNFMFILPLFLVLLFALWGATSQHFSNFLKKHIIPIKIIMAILFFLFGFIIFKTS